MQDLKDGESTEMQGSGAKPYVLKNTGGVYSCSCPAWRNQSLPIERRSCKHLVKLRGKDAEKSRVGNPAIGSAIIDRSSGTREENNKQAPPLLLAHSWDNFSDPTNWWMSEKLDGVRAYWDGSQLLSRLGTKIHAPDWFTLGLPSVPLDGELWIGRKMFQKTVGIVKRQDKSDHWRQVCLRVFDAPKSGLEFEQRLDVAASLVKKCSLQHIQLHEHFPCKGIDHLRSELSRVESLGGEGLMLRKPGSAYEVGRSFTLLKVKTFHDAEARVVGHQPGRGKHKGKLGALLVELENGTAFSLGTGFSDAQRLAPPQVGSLVTFRYQELTDGGVPRFPSFLRIHEDIAADTADKTKGKAVNSPTAKKAPKATKKPDNKS